MDLWSKLLSSVFSRRLSGQRGKLSGLMWVVKGAEWALLACGFNDVMSGKIRT